MTTKNNNFNYFKVNQDILDIEITKSELWVYLTHCRCRGQKTKGLSIAGYNATIKIFNNKISKITYDKCINSLINKKLIELSTEKVNKGYYKINQVIKIINGKKNIQLPIELLDNKIITNSTVEDIKNIIRLYELYDPLGSYGGLNHNYIYAYNDKKEYTQVTTFGDGYNRTIVDKPCYAINYPTKYKKYEKIDNLNNYSFLFNLKPLIIEYDPEDTEITNVKYEIFPNMDNRLKEKHNNTYFTAIENDNTIIKWVLEPIYPVKNNKYFEYIELKENAYKIACEIYKDYDNATDLENIKNIFYNYKTDLSIFLEDINNESVDSNRIHNLLIKISENDYTINSVDNLKKEHELIITEIEKEKDIIENENIRLSKLNNKRTRKTTSNRLKTLENNLTNIENEIFKITTIENELIKIIPPWIIDRFLNEIE